MNYFLKIAQNEEKTISQLIREQDQSTRPSTADETDLKFYEDMLKTLKPEKAPSLHDIEPFEDEPPTKKEHQIVQMGPAPKIMAEPQQDYESENYEPEGLEGEILMTYGPKPPLKILLLLLQEHGNKAHALGHGISVEDESHQKGVIPATLRAVMDYLGY